MNDPRFKFLPFLNEKYKLELDIKGSLVYRNGQLKNPFEVKEILDQVYSAAERDFIQEMFWKSIDDNSKDYS